MVKPLIVLTVYNRADETRRTLEGLEATTDLSQVEIAIVDNASEDGAGDVVREFANRLGMVRAHHLDENIGCPRALNLALRRHRKPGQPVMKLDNDAVILTDGWLGKVRRLAEGDRVAMVSAHWDSVLGSNDSRLIRNLGGWLDLALYQVGVVVGHCVWHSGAFMDRVGYFDVLHPDHLYGFEDLLMSAKARVDGWAMLVWEGWRVRNIQRRNALGERKDAHVTAMRPHYNDRLWALRRGRTVWTGPDGTPGEPV